MKILIVDDEQPIRETLEMVLMGRGYSVITAEDGPAALRACESEHPDLVLLDICLPKMSGIEVLQTIKKKHENITVIMVTVIFSCFFLIV